ncbi:MAG: PAS domain-containing protein, partial [Duganella sp.]
MNKPQRPQLRHDELREAAEHAVAALSTSGLMPPLGADSDTLRHWHELQVSQIELDMQSMALADIASERDQAEAGRNRYAALYDQAPAGYLSLDASGAITRANHAAGELLGYRREALVGKRFEQFVAPQAQAALRRFLIELMEHGQRSVLEVPLFDPRGDDVPLRVHIEANLDALAGSCRMILTDIGSADVREAARRQAFQVLDSMEEGVLVCDVNLDIISVNRAFVALTGYPVEEALGRHPRFLEQHGANPAGFQNEVLRCMHSYGKWQGEVRNRRRDGSTYVAALSLTTVRDEQGAISRYIGVFSDITARQQAEADLLKLSRELDVRGAPRPAELTEPNPQLVLEVAERTRTEAAE